MDTFIKILRISLILFILTWFVIWFSIRSDRKQLNETNQIDRIIVSLSKIPFEIKQYFQMMSEDDHLEKPINITADLYEVGKLQEKSYLDDSHYLLYYRYLGGNSGQVQLQNIKNGDVAMTWDIPLEEMMDDIKAIESELTEMYMEGEYPLEICKFFSKNVSVIRAYSPIMTADSSLVFHGIFSYLYKIDKHSNIVWKSKKLAHHSIEVDAEGNFWTCSIDLKNDIANDNHFRDDAILCIDPNGVEKYFFSLTQVFFDNNLFYDLIGNASSITKIWAIYDPFHLNDIQPTKEDGKYWDKGDIFLSFRHPNLVALYRPSNDSIIWHKKGPWLMQHDVNIINDSIISVFNNNPVYFENLKYFSNITYYNFANDKTHIVGDSIFATISNGHQTYTSNGDLVIEETGNSIYFVLDSLGNLRNKFYIPYYSNSERAQYPSWSRVYIKKDNTFILQ